MEHSRMHCTFFEFFELGEEFFLFLAVFGASFKENKGGITEDAVGCTRMPRGFVIELTV